MEVQDTILSVDELLSRSAAAVKSGRTNNKNLSAVQKLLAGREDPEDTVELSPVARLLQEQEARDPSNQESYFESDAFLQAKVSQLRGQIATYSTLPGLDPDGSAMAGLTQQVNAIIQLQQDRLRETNEEAAAKQKELDEKNAEAARLASIPTAEQLLERAAARVNGEDVAPFGAETAEDRVNDPAVEALLRRSREAVDVNA